MWDLDKIDLSKTGEIFRKLEFRALNDRLKKTLGLEDEEKEIEKSEIKIDEEKLRELKLAITILNPNIINPSLDDILNY